MNDSEASAEDGFEPVYTVTSYYDGPRRGVASVGGTPHAYRSLFDDAADEYSDIFELHPIEEDTLRLVFEAREIWLRWIAAHEAGLTAIESHPALPADRARHDELDRILAPRLAAPEGSRSVRARAEFRSLPGPGRVTTTRPLVARWTVIEP